RLFSRTLAEHIYIRPLVVVPISPFDPIVGRNLPRLVYILFPSQQASFLLIVADMEEELENNCIVIRKQLLKIINFFITTAPDGLRYKVVYPNNEHIFIVGTIENGQ